MAGWVKDKGEIEITDLILQLKQKLAELKGNSVLIFHSNLISDKNQTNLHYNINKQMELLIGKISFSCFKI